MVMTQEQKELRDKLFPDGMPTPEEFIRILAEEARKRMEDDQKKEQ